MERVTNLRIACVGLTSDGFTVVNDCKPSSNICIMLWHTGSSTQGAFHIVQWLTVNGRAVNSVEGVAYSLCPSLTVAPGSFSSVDSVALQAKYRLVVTSSQRSAFLRLY